MKVYITSCFFALSKMMSLSEDEIERERIEMKFLLITEIIIIEYVLLHTYDDDVIKYDRGRIFFNKKSNQVVKLIYCKQ